MVIQTIVLLLNQVNQFKGATEIELVLKSFLKVSESMQQNIFSKSVRRIHKVNRGYHTLCFMK